MVCKFLQQGKLGRSAKKAGRVWQIDPVKADKILDGALAPGKRAAQAKRKKARKPRRRSKPLDPQASPAAASPAEEAEKIKEAGFESLTLAQAQEMKERYKAANEKLKYEKDKLMLVEASKVERDAFDLARRLRDGMLAIPERLAAVLTGETDERKILALLRSEIAQVLEEVAT